MTGLAYILTFYLAASVPVALLAARLLRRQS